MLKNYPKKVPLMRQQPSRLVECNRREVEMPRPGTSRGRGLMSSVSSEMTARAAARGRVNGMLAVLALLGFVGNLRAEDDTEFFEKKVRPILAGHCYRCHNAAKKQGGGLVLDSRAGRRKGGETGPAVRPGDPEGSLLVKAVRRQGDSPRGASPAASSVGTIKSSWPSSVNISRTCG